MAEAELSKEVGNTGGVEDEAATTAEEKELVQWAESAGEASSAGTGAPLIEDVPDESSKEEVEAVDPPAMGSGRVLWRAGSGEPVQPGRAAPPQQAQEGSARKTRAAAARKLVKAMVKKKITFYSSSKRGQTPPSSPPPADIDAEVIFDFGPSAQGAKGRQHKRRWRMSKYLALSFFCHLRPLKLCRLS